EKAEAYDRQNQVIDARQAPLKAEIKKIEAPYERKLRQDAYKEFPDAVQQAIAKAEADSGRRDRHRRRLPVRARRRRRRGDRLSEMQNLGRADGKLPAYRAGPL